MSKQKPRAGVWHLPSKHKALSSNSSPIKKKKKKRDRNYKEKVNFKLQHMQKDRSKTERLIMDRKNKFFKYSSLATGQIH
jgi:hypothetical protein